MAKKTATKENTKPADAPRQAENAGSVTAPQSQVETGQAVAVSGYRPRLGYPARWCQYYGVSPQMWVTLIDNIWPAAKTIEGVCRGIAYCRERNLDMMKKPVHIVPVYSSALDATIELVWPGITEVRITAMRTGVYAGKDAAVFGPLIKHKFQHLDTRKNPPVVTKEVTLEFPEWVRVDVYRLVQGVRCKFEGPKVFWLEAYATESRWSECPNEMWEDRKSGQIEKCGEAASLRSTFPEELGGEYIAEEMHGKIINFVPPEIPNLSKTTDPVASPPGTNGKSEFAKPAEEVADHEQHVHKGDTPAAAKTQAPVEGGDGRPEPPAQGELVVDEQESQDPPDAGVTVAVLDSILQKGQEHFKMVNKLGELADTREIYEQDLPPDGPHVQKLVAAYDARVAHLKAKPK